MEDNLHKPSRKGNTSHEDGSRFQDCSETLRENPEKKSRGRHHNKRKYWVAELKKLNYQFECELEQKKQMDLNLDESQS